MIPRYTRKTMGVLWTVKNIKSEWLNVERAVLLARERLGEIPKGTCRLSQKVNVTDKVLARADEFERKKDHDLIAFVLAITELLPDPVKPYFHDGLTSFDVEDTALAIILAKSIDLIILKAETLKEVIRHKANEHRNTIMIGRTHFIHAEPITFGLKLLNWVYVIEEHLENLKIVREKVAVGKISGAAGNYPLDPEVESLTCHCLGLNPAKISNQVLDRHILVRYTSALVATANSLDKFATEIRHLAGTDIGEVREFKKPGASGSSAMPGKSLLRNPIKSENICGLVKDVRGKIITSLECEILWCERTLDNSAPERIYLPDVTILLDFMLHRFTATIKKLEIFPDQMMRNLRKTGGVVFAQRVMMALTKKKMPRYKAYELLENLALTVAPGLFKDKDGKTFRQIVAKHSKITKLLTQAEIRKCFDPKQSLKHVDTVFKRFGL